ADRRRVDATLTSYPPERVEALLAHVRRPLEREALDRANLFVSLQMVASNLGMAPEETRLELGFAPLPEPAPFLDCDSLVRIPWEHAWSASSDRDSVLGLGDGAVRGRVLELRARLAPGATTRARWIVPAYP